MKFTHDKKYFPIAVACTATVAACAVIVLIAMNLSKIPSFFSSVLSIISPFIHGFFIAYICNPIMRLFEEKVFRKANGKRYVRPLSIACALLALLLFITLIFLIVIPQLSQSYNDLAANFNNYIVKAQSYADSFVKNFRLFNGKYENLTEFLNASEIANELKNLIDKAGSLLSSVANYVITNAVNFVVEIKNIVMGIIISVYFLFSKETLLSQAKKILSAFLSRRRYLNAVELGRYANKTIGGYISGKILDSLMLGVVSLILFLIFGIPYAPLISVIVGVTNVIPYFGPFIGAIPSAFIILIAEPKKTIVFIILVIVTQQIDGNLIEPKILGDSIGLSAMSVLVAIIIGGGLFGIIGMLLGVPAYAVIREIVVQRLDNRLIKRSLPKSLSFYANDPVIQRSDSDKPQFLNRDAVVEEPFVDYSIQQPEEKTSSQRSTTFIELWNKLKKLIMNLIVWMKEKIKAIKRK